jgi:glucose-1-phosphate thymidylyltransferase
MISKGIILSGGVAVRLAPASFGASKQLMPIYDKPMIYYPLSLLMEIGIRNILIISTPYDLDNFQRLFSYFRGGDLLGISIEYAIQPQPRGIAQAFTIGKHFIAGDKVALILGDNIIHGHETFKPLQDATKLDQGAIIFGCHVKNPSAYGVVEFDSNFKVISLEEKPTIPKSNYAVPGIYFYDNLVVEYANNLTPSLRGELEITDVNNIYLKNNKLSVKVLGNDVNWFDTGTHENMLLASSYVRDTQLRNGSIIACLEEIAFRRGWIGDKELDELANLQAKTAYGSYLKRLGLGRV